MLGLLTVNVFLILGLKSLEQSLEKSAKNSDSFIMLALSYGPGAVIFGVNQVAKWLFNFLAAKTKLESKTQEYAFAS